LSPFELKTMLRALGRAAKIAGRSESRGEPSASKKIGQSPTQVCIAKLADIYERHAGLRANVTRIDPSGIKGGRFVDFVAAVAAKDLLPPPTTQEAMVIADAVDRVDARRARIDGSTEGKDGVFRIGAPHSHHEGFVARLFDAFGTTSQAFGEQGMGELAAIVRSKNAFQLTQNELNAGLAAIDGIKPADETEAMLALQMVATHQTAMDMLIHAKGVENTPHRQECGSLAVKLLQTYTAQVEALSRLRRGGEQRVVVQHVNVNEGGQAIVGAVSRSSSNKA